MEPKLNVLLVGSGGREHALAWKLLQSPLIENLYVAPGNAGTLDHNIPINSSDVAGLVNFAKEKNCFTIVGPEAPLELGLIDRLNEKELKAFGPTSDQACLETSKSFAKRMLCEASIPTAEFRIFADYENAIDYAIKKEGKVVIKVDGLAAGKGVFVCSDLGEAEAALKRILLDRIFGKAGDTVVIEDRLEGYEVSMIALCDGRRAVSFGNAMDHKRLLDGNKGPNTGGMGAFSPAVRFDEEMQDKVLDKVVQPIVKKSGFSGFLYTGLMVTEDGPKVLEFNVRLGDPETQCMLPRLDADLLKILVELRNTPEEILAQVRWLNQFSCTVVMCSPGYPASPKTGMEISGLESAAKIDDVVIFHAGTKKSGSQVFTTGGRVLCVTGQGMSLEEASAKAYSAVKLISWKGEHHRSDIGKVVSD